MLIVQACEFMFTGDGFYRHHEPSRFLGRLPGVTVIDCHLTHRYLWPLARQCDVLIIPVLSNWELFPLIEERRKEGKLTVLETNDYFHSMQPWNPIAEFWADPAVQEEHLAHIRISDAIQTSTTRLANHWKNDARECVVFPNQLNAVPPLLPPKDRPLTIGWGGSQGHLADWFETAKVLQPWLDAHPEVHVAVMCHAAAKDYLTLPPERYYFQQGGILAEYLGFLGRLDIGIAPLLPTEYNRCRSDVKYLEYAAYGIAGIYSALDPYEGTVRHGENGLLYRTASELLSSLDALVNDHDKRNAIRTAAYEEVSTTRRLEQHIGTRFEFYRAHLKKAPWTGTLPSEVLQAGDLDANYLRLISGDMERPLLDALVNRPTKEAIPPLVALLKQFPDYMLCGRVLQKLLNDVGRPRDALTVSEQMQRIAPGQAQTVSEIGRANYLVGDHEAGERSLREAIQLNPSQVSSWEYLVRFLKFRKSPALDTALEEMQKQFPLSYRQALLAARLQSPEASVQTLMKQMKLCREKLSARELENAAVDFVLTIEIVVSQRRESPEACEILELGRDLFPQSARLATLAGWIFREQKQLAKSDTAFREAYRLHVIGRRYAREYPPDDFTSYTWQVAEYVANEVPRGEVGPSAQTAEKSKPGAPKKPVGKKKK